MGLGPFADFAADLAPGDRRVLDVDWSAFELHSVTGADDPAFEQAWSRLWREFGDRGEMERREVIADRLGWRAGRPVDGRAMLYELVALRRSGRTVALRDHTAIGTASGRVVVHLSHALVEPELRGSGLASWLRALPVQAARRCAAEAGSRDPAITLVAEMDHDDGSAAAGTRLRSYARAGFRMVDPRQVAYQQPDFRSAAEIDRSSVQPVAMSLVLRRVGKEAEGEMPGEELREIVDALHAMFGVHVRPDHMAGVRAAALGFPSRGEPVTLLLPTELHGGAAQEIAP